MPDGEKTAPKPPHQFGIRSFMLLTVVMAVWFWLFRGITPAEMTIFTSFALVVGLLAHLVYTFLLPQRLVGLISILLFYNVTLALLTVVSAGFQNPISETFETIVAIIRAPATIIPHASSPRELFFSVTIVAGTLLLTPAHAIQPNLVSALITSMGVGIWYVAGILVLSYGA